MVSWCKKGEYNAQISPNQSYVGSSGQTLTTDVSMTLCNGALRSASRAKQLIWSILTSKRFVPRMLYSRGMKSMCAEMAAYDCPHHDMGDVLVGVGVWCLECDCVLLLKPQANTQTRGKTRTSPVAHLVSVPPPPLLATSKNALQVQRLTAHTHAHTHTTRRAKPKLRHG